MNISNEVDRIFALQQNNVWAMKTSTLVARKALITQLRDRLLRAGEEVAEALHLDMGRPKTAMPFDVQTTIDAANEALEKLDAWAAPTLVPANSKTPGVQSYIHYEARGKVLIIGPWNFPFHLIVEPLISALAAGNTVIIKPASMAPATSAVLTRIIRDVFDESQVAVIEGNSDVANALLDKPFDHIFFTGSPKVGKIIMAAAAKHLTSVTLELGGKNPAVLDPTADLRAAAEAVITSRTMNNGQTCLSIDYVLVPRESVGTFIEHAATSIRAQSYHNGKFDAALTGRFIDERNFSRVKDYVEDAVKQGARVVAGGSSNADDLTMEPTILMDVATHSDIMQEEIFGPVVVVVPYDTADEAFSIIQRHGKPLGSMVFSTDDHFVQAFLQRTTSGGVSVNTWAGHFFDGNLPFGGVNGSGTGTYHSVYGFREFSHARAVFAQGLIAS